jgi:hypothetical protein
LNQKNLSFDLVIQDNTPVSFRKNIKIKFKNLIVDQQECDGLSDSRNISANIASTEYIHFLDDDVSFDSNFVNNIYNSIDLNSNCAAIGGKIIDDWGSESKPSWCSKKILAMMSCIDLGDKILPFGPGKNNANWLVGANLLFKKSLYIKYGGFPIFLGRNSNNNTLLSNEENFLLKKIYKNHDIIYDPSICINHFIDKAKIDKSWITKRFAWQSVSDLLSNDSWNSKIDNLSHLDYISIINRQEFNSFDQYLSCIQNLVHKLLD